MDKKQALPDRILAALEKPARYIGNEHNCVQKDPAKIDVRFAMCFPDVYEIGMSHLGIQIIYEQLNRRSDTWCERVYSPWPDLAAVMRREKIPLFALESQDPVRNFDILGITLQYELCYTNVLEILALAGIPLHAADRGDDDPVVLGGGPCTYNPEPIAPFFDLFYIGESEVVMDLLVDTIRDLKKAGFGRKEILREAGKIPGIYAPSFYETEYHGDGTIASFEPVDPGMPRSILRQAAMNLDETPYPEKPIVPYIRPTQDRVVLEIQRGCIRGCRFCQAGMVYRPLRGRSRERLLSWAETMLDSSGQEEISLSSLSSSDYKDLPGLLAELMRICPEKHVNISLPSLRIDNFSLDVMSRVQDVKKSSLTFAPEAGTQRLRNVINKGLTEEDILGGALEAFRGGWNRVKLYFMLGLPTEAEEDRKGIAHLAQAICETFYDGIPKEERTRAVDITVSTSFFVPKPFTPFQWASMLLPETYVECAHQVRDEIRQMKNQKRIHYKWHDPEGTELEGLLARGDRRVAAVIEAAWRRGACFDAWTDQFRYGIWKEAMEETGINPDFYTRRVREISEILPWDFIDIGVSRSFLEKEWKRAVEDQTVTPSCREKCSGCGASRYGGGICFERKDGEGVKRTGPGKAVES